MNKHVANNILLRERGDSLDNLYGYPRSFNLPLMEDVPGKYMNTMYSPSDITVNWNSYKHFLKEVKTGFLPSRFICRVVT